MIAINTILTILCLINGHIRVSSLTHVTDWAPTLLSLAGSDREGEFDGVIINMPGSHIYIHSFPFQYWKKIE